MKKDYLCHATCIQGEFYSQIRCLAEKSLKESPCPIVAVSFEKKGVVVIEKIRKIPQYGKEYEAETLDTIFLSDESSDSAACDRINDCLAKHCNRNKIFISEDVLDIFCE